RFMATPIDLPGFDSMVIAVSFLNAAGPHPRGYSPLVFPCAWGPTPMRSARLATLARPAAGAPLAAGYRRQSTLRTILSAFLNAAAPHPRSRYALRSRLATGDSLFSERLCLFLCLPPAIRLLLPTSYPYFAACCTAFTMFWYP